LFAPDVRFTDDTVPTVATGDALLGHGDYAGAYRRYGRAFRSAGYGASFYGWLLRDDAGPNRNWVNGAAMRATPVGFALDSAEVEVRCG
jgi:ADP-ribosylglycohydrolase